MALSFDRHTLPTCLTAFLLIGATTSLAADDANSSGASDANALIVHLHRTALGRQPTEAETTAARALLKRSAGYETILLGLIDGEHYLRRKRDDKQFIMDAFQLILGRPPTKEEAAGVAKKLTDGTSRLMAAMTLMATADYKQAKARRLSGQLGKATSEKKPEGSGKKAKPKNSKSKPTDQSTTGPQPKQKPTAKPKPKARPKPDPKAPAVTKKQLAAARKTTQAAWKELSALVRDPEVPLDSPKLVDARKAYFQARESLRQLRRSKATSASQADGREDRKGKDTSK